MWSRYYIYTYLYTVRTYDGSAAKAALYCNSEHAYAKVHLVDKSDCFLMLYAYECVCIGACDTQTYEYARRTKREGAGKGTLKGIHTLEWDQIKESVCAGACTVQVHGNTRFGHSSKFALKKVSLRRLFHCFSSYLLALSSLMRRRNLDVPGRRTRTSLKMRFWRGSGSVEKEAVEEGDARGSVKGRRNEVALPVICIRSSSCWGIRLGRHLQLNHVLVVLDRRRQWRRFLIWNSFLILVMLLMHGHDQVGLLQGIGGHSY